MLLLPFEFRGFLERCSFLATRVAVPLVHELRGHSVDAAVPATDDIFGVVHFLLVFIVILVREP